MTAELMLQRDLDAPPERVWRALTDPAALAAWFWPPRLDPAAEVDLAVGGGYRIAGPGAGIAVAGRYLEDATRDDHVQGWTDCLGRLPAWLASDRG